ncbi:putative iron-regulated membrane protein [Variovorax boronicumulans]|uniref:PepSY-associated TM helix domain-containing protein n=1 Tax=Variovorax boronicumulans TaxID=436515 RepID=UPI002783630C|nr:PepSY-associated TM helix domain-containing protein [Variovorax boronicumulans]MDP9912720.1 putative iron-regulated membrane protein [Variovorax boronicumulans]
MSTKTTKAASQGGFRQAQAWLHTWCGLWFSWLLFAVFLTGTLAVFDEPITHWMTPEHHAEEAAAAAKKEKGEPTVDRAQRLAWGMAYMAEHHPGASMWELWPSDAQGGGELRVFWFDANRQYAGVALDPATGKPLKEEGGHAARATLGGHHFVDFHYELHAGTVGLWIVGIAAMAMLVALVSGVITHKRIFKDFFTFRPKKGQRSWLDAHNAVAVLTLPFQFMIAYTGLVISGTSFMPAPKVLHYGTGPQAQVRFVSELGDSDKPAATGRAMPVPVLEPFAARGQERMGQPVRAVVIDHPGDAAARIGVYGWNGDDESARRLSATTGMVQFSAATGEVQRVRLPGAADGGAALLAQSAMGGLHMVTFGGWPMKWLYFLCGLAGTAMMGSGAVLFIVKRRQKHLGEFGGATARVYRLVEALNVAAIAGLAIACVGYLWANRLVPVGIGHRADRELQVFFALWALALVHAFVRQPARAWREQLGALAALCLLLPVLNFVTTGDHLLAQFLRSDWESLGVELGVVAFGFAALGALRHLRRKAAR